MYKNVFVYTKEILFFYYIFVKCNYDSRLMPISAFGNEYLFKHMHWFFACLYNNQNKMYCFLHDKTFFAIIKTVNIRIRLSCDT